MQPISKLALGVLCAATLACASAPRTAGGAADPGAEATIAQVYFWRARPGMLEAYNRYIRDVAEPIDREAQRTGAFLSVTTYAARDTTLPWTHMRVFLFRDSAQLRGLSAALSAAGPRLEPDSTRRRQQSEYSATLRDRVGGDVMDIVK